MKKTIFLLIALCALVPVVVFALGEGGIQGGGSGSGNATSITDDIIVAADIKDNVITSAKLLDNTIATGKIADGTIVNADISSSAAIAATKIDLSAYAPLVSPSFTTPTLGVASATSLDTGQGANELYDMDQNVQTTDNVVFGTVTADEFISNAADNTRGVTVPNTADPTGANLAAGKGWFNITSNTLKFRNGDNSATLTYAQVDRLKTFSFAIDNVAATDNVLMWRVPVAITLTQANCYATTDNVIGNLMECATDDVTSCTVLDAWTVTNAVDDFTDASMTDGAVAAGAWIRWSTTSVGSALNRLTCTIQYNE